ncbi:unnamed protein product [Nippostrongylus brasiliensis]|uniref:OstA-like_N domain-containing protein n=1 Tax=Nippostrongylus brasiliensis TaxID=27835 RepID=A0A0N4Y6Q7_NIPBR|nr:unnamed protein product [Nippostrongylus brasiliensis]
MNQQEYTVVKGERFDAKRPKDSEIFHGDGSFTDKTMYQQEYVYSGSCSIEGRNYQYYTVRSSREESGSALEGTSRKNLVMLEGDRYNVRRAIESAVSKRTSPLLGKSVSQEDYVAVKGERCLVKRPKDSNVLMYDGTFSGVTVHQRDYVTIKGERYELSRPRDCGIFDAEPAHLTETGAKRRHSMTTAEPSGICRSKSSDLLHRGSCVRGRETSGKKPKVKSKGDVLHSGCAASSHAHEPDVYSSKLRARDYVFKPQRCPAGELVKSIRQNHTNTSRFHFAKCDKGHHFYKPLDSEK